MTMKVSLNQEIYYCIHVIVRVMRRTVPHIATGNGQDAIASKKTFWVSGWGFTFTDPLTLAETGKPVSSVSEVVQITIP
jgi:hypothetical protein